VLTHFEKTAPRGEIAVAVGGKPIVKEARKVNCERRITHEYKKIIIIGAGSSGLMIAYCQKGLTFLI
jgi:ribulose 1,5-bisphosphate synthetase/thiazole synthase